MDLILFSRLEEREGIIQPLDYTFSFILNGLNTLDFTALPTENYTLEKGKRILVKDELGIWREYIISQVEKRHSTDGVTISAMCEDSIIELEGDFVEDKRPYNQTVGGALEAALKSTRWTVGRTANLGLRSTNFYRISAHEALGKILETWGGEFRPRIVVDNEKVVGRYVDILDTIGENLGRRFEWKKDIKEIKRTVSSDPIYTALYGYGKGLEIGEGFGRRLDFADINNGVAYVENTEAKERYGPINPDGSHRNIFSKFECEAETPEELIALTKVELEKVSKPKVIYEAKVINLAQYGFDFEGVGLGDDVAVIDDEIGVVKAKVVKLIKEPEAKETKITIGNYRDNFSELQKRNANTLQDFASRAGIWDRANAFGADGYLNPNYLKDVLDAFNSELNESGGYVYAEEGKGISTYDRPKGENPEGVTQLLGAGIRIASSKLSDGSWNWRTAMTSMGIIADVIYTGRIVGQTSFYDLDAGILQFNANMGGREVQVVLSIARGLEIYSDGEKIGGLEIVDNEVSLIANKLTNDKKFGWAEIGKVNLKNTYDGLENVETNGLKLVLKSPKAPNDRKTLQIGSSIAGQKINGVTMYFEDSAFLSLKNNEFALGKFKKESETEFEGAVINASSKQLDISYGTYERDTRNRLNFKDGPTISMHNGMLNLAIRQNGQIMNLLQLSQYGIYGQFGGKTVKLV